MDAGRKKHVIIGGGGSYGQQLAWRFTFFTWFNHCYGWLGHGIGKEVGGLVLFFCHRICLSWRYWGLTVRVVSCGSLALVRSGFRRLAG